MSPYSGQPNSPKRIIYYIHYAMLEYIVGICHCPEPGIYVIYYGECIFIVGNRISVNHSNLFNSLGILEEFEYIAENGIHARLPNSCHLLWEYAIFPFLQYIPARPICSNSFNLLRFSNNHNGDTVWSLYMQYIA